MPVVTDSGREKGFPLLLQQLQLEVAEHDREATVGQGNPKTTTARRGPRSTRVELLRCFDNFHATVVCLGIVDSAGLVVDNSAAGHLELLGADFLGPGSFADCPHSYTAAAAAHNSAADDLRSPGSADNLLLMENSAADWAAVPPAADTPVDSFAGHHRPEVGPWIEIPL